MQKCQARASQCKLTFTSVTNRRPVADEVDLYDGRRLTINRGLGVVKYPVGFNARPEITVFTLRRDDV